MLDADDALVAFRCFGTDARVAGADYRADTFNMGRGLRPNLTRRRFGPTMIYAALTCAQEQPIASFASLHATWRARPLRHAHCRPRPLRYVAFLDYSVALLLRVGGGCAFPHRLLRDHIGALSDADIADLAARDQH